jgi:hypothetical protein
MNSWFTTHTILEATNQGTFTSQNHQFALPETVEVVESSEALWEFNDPVPYCEDEVQEPLPEAFDVDYEAFLDETDPNPKRRRRPQSVHSVLAFSFTD